MYSLVDSMYDKVGKIEAFYHTFHLRLRKALLCISIFTSFLQIDRAQYHST